LGKDGGSPPNKYFSDSTFIHRTIVIVMRVLMVCLGNICRSPLAEGIMKQQAARAGFEWFVDSAGTGHWHTGALPDPRSIQTAHTHGIDITDQRARQILPIDFDRFDRIFVMDVLNLNDVLHLARNEVDRSKVSLLLDQVYPRQNQSVPDPYHDDDGFEAVFQMLELSCAAFVDRYQPA
jgi:protein-tyrosine phosphatase